MLKSTHRGGSGGPAPLAEGWTEHKAPTGHSYYYNAATKQSTYERPVAPPAPAAAPAAPSVNPSQSFFQYQAVGSLIPSGGPALNNFDFQESSSRGGRGGFNENGGGRGGHDRPRDFRPQPTDKPKSRHPIPDCSPWVLVHTKLGRRFVYNSEKDQSYWRIPDKLKNGILKLDQLRIKEKAEALQKGIEHISTGEAPGAAGRPIPVSESARKDVDDADDVSEYEEVEVTDDEDEENPAKRQRTEEPGADQPLEFNEDDIAFQLAAMGAEYGLDPGEYDDGNMEEWDEGAEGLELSEEDAVALFQDLLNDYRVNPFSPWEKLVEEGKLLNDTRYTALTTMRARKEAWDSWSREKMLLIREQREKEAMKDPRIPYLAFLQKNVNPKLYWPEFKRKFKKDPEMRDAALADKDREKFYREHVKRLLLPQSTLKSDLSKLLADQPLSILNKATPSSHLPPAVLSDIRYISLDPAFRDKYIENYISTLNPPPESVDIEETEVAIKDRKDKERRQNALNERERRVAEEKQRQKKNLEIGKGRLREEELEIERAMNVSKKGLKDHLMAEETVSR